MSREDPTTPTNKSETQDIALTEVTILTSDIIPNNETANQDPRIKRIKLDESADLNKMMSQNHHTKGKTAQEASINSCCDSESVASKRMDNTPTRKRRHSQNNATDTKNEVRNGCNQINTNTDIIYDDIKPSLTTPTSFHQEFAMCGQQGNNGAQYGSKIVPIDQQQYFGNHLVPGHDDQQLAYDNVGNDFYPDLQKHQNPDYSKMHFPYISGGSIPVDSKQLHSSYPLSASGSPPSSPNQHGYELDSTVHKQHGYAATSSPNYSPYMLGGNPQSQFTYDQNDPQQQSQTTQLSRQDPKYFERRKKNNEASKKSRAKKKEHVKEMENKARNLEDENRDLRIKQDQLQKEIASYKQQLSDKMANVQQVVPTGSPTHITHSYPDVFPGHLPDYFSQQQQPPTHYTTH